MKRTWMREVSDCRQSVHAIATSTKRVLEKEVRRKIRRTDQAMMLRKCKASCKIVSVPVSKQIVVGPEEGCCVLERL